MSDRREPEDPFVLNVSKHEHVRCALTSSRGRAVPSHSPVDKLRANGFGCTRAGLIAGLALQVGKLRLQARLFRLQALLLHAQPFNLRLQVA